LQQLAVFFISHKNKNIRFQIKAEKNHQQNLGHTKSNMSMKKAPHFSLPDQDNVVHSLEEYLGSWILIYFYPKDDTPGCTREACAFRDIADVYKQKNVTVIGISKDSVSSHKKFAEKHRLTFTLLSDESTNIIKAYGAWGEKKFMGRTFDGIKRISFLIGPDQTIQKEYLKVDVFNHAKEILNDLEMLTQKT
jgi:peroxiredoxin Q/BCP